MTTGGIGHNGGPALAGRGWQRHCWRQARESLLPTLPIEVVRLRVKRAAALGLDYRSYASVRAQTGHDLVAFLFSSNALRVTARLPQMPAGHAAKLEGVQAGRLGLAVAPLEAGAMASANPVLAACHPAPWALAPWAEMRAQIRAALGDVPPDRVALIGGYGAEADWVAAGRLAAFIPESRYFAG